LCFSWQNIFIWIFLFLQMIDYLRNTIFFLLYFFSAASGAYAELKLESVYPTLGIMGNDLNVNLTGTGFNENTRVSMYLDAGHKKAIIGSLNVPGESWDVKVSGSTAYVVGTMGLQIVDVTYPDIPRQIGSMATSEYINKIAVSGDLAFIVGASGLSVIDVSTPTNPVQISFVSTPDEAWGVAVKDDIVYVVEDGIGFQVIDVSTPSNPRIVGSVYLDYYAYDIVLSADKAYVAMRGGLQVIDISDSANPVLLGAIITELFACGINISGSTVYLVNFGGLSSESLLQVIDVSDSNTPVLISSLPTPGLAMDVAIKGNTVYMTDGGTGIQIIDVSTQSSPEVIGTVDTPGTAWGITVENNTAYVADSDGGLQVIDVTESSAHTVIGSLDTPDEAAGIVVVGNIAYLADGESGLQVVDISTPSDPQIIGSVDTPGNASKIIIQNNTAYLTDWESGLQIVNISNPSTPTITGALDTPGRSYGITVKDSKAYVADFEGGLQIINVSTPSAPWLMGSLDTGGYAITVAITGNTAYVACGNDGLKIVNISDPANPELIRSINTITPFEVEIVENTAYVSDGSGIADTLQILDVTDPANPVVIASLNVPWAAGITVAGERVYMIDTSGGIQVVDVSNPSHPTLIGFVDTSAYANDVVIIDNKAYVANGKNGFAIVPVPIEIKPVNLDASTSITLPSPILPGHYTLRVFDENDSHELPGAVSFVPVEQSSILNIKAIIIAGSKSGDKIKEEIQRNANNAYNALIFQGFTHESIYYLSSESGSDIVDAAATYANLSYAINTWTREDPSASELMLYFVDHGKAGSFGINANEDLLAEDLDNWLDTLQATMPGQIIFIYDACRSGTFLSSMKPPAGKKRIVLTSAADEPANFLGNGTITFSYQFWNIIDETGILDEAFFGARDLMKLFNQTALLDANGNGVGNEHEDFIQADNILIRRGYKTDFNIPKIIEVSAEKYLFGETSATLWANVFHKADEEISRVWAIIVPPNFSPEGSDIPISELPTAELLDFDNDGIYEIDWDAFATEGTYAITINAVDIRGIHALSKQTTVTQTSGNLESLPDDYENDDSDNEANVIVINDTTSQYHNFAEASDADWVKFYGIAGQAYKIKASELSSICNVVIEIYDSVGAELPLELKNDGIAGEDEFLDWFCPKNGIYYVKIRNWNNNIFGANTKYDLEVYRPVGPVTALFTGVVTDANTGTPIAGAVIQTTGDTSAISFADSGVYRLIQEPGTETMNVAVTGYKVFTDSITVTEEGIITKNIEMVPFDLSSAISILQVLAGMEPSSIVKKEGDVNTDRKIGIEEVIHILQKVSELR